MKLRYPVIAMLFAIAAHHAVNVIEYAAEVSAKAHAYDADGCAAYEQALYKMAVYELPVKGK
jgi:hypothetical protein